MKLFEINEAILDCLNLDTGEITDIEKFENLKMERQDKLTNIALLYINMKADAEAYEKQEKKFSNLKKNAKSTMEWCKATLAKELAGQPLKDDEKRFSITWRASEKLEITDPDKVSEEWKKVEVKYDVAGMKQAIKDGAQVDGAVISVNNNIQIR